MSVVSMVDAVLDDSFARRLPELCHPWQAAPAPAPRLIVANDRLAADLGWEPTELHRSDALGYLIGTEVLPGSHPVAQVYAGHQFGSYSERLGDGRALLLGEVTGVDGRRWDVHLKGSGRTPLARGGDGKAALGPMLREFLMGEAMVALGVPSTRGLAVVATGETIQRDSPLPGAVLCRVAASHLRVGTFEYAARSGDADLLARLADYAIERHYPALAGSPSRYLDLFAAVVDAQAALVARWMLVGFIHGVMNTDNMTISGETIDYGPCAFMDAYDPATVFSSIDHGGRYAYGNQPVVAQWNLARLGESLLAVIDQDWHAAVEPATAVLRSFSASYEGYFAAGLRAKLGLADTVGEFAAQADDLGRELLEIMAGQRADFTGTFRSLSATLRAESAMPAQALVGAASWYERWLAAIDRVGRRRDLADAMDRVNPVVVPRNHLVDEALIAATVGELAPYRQLLAALAQPFEQRPRLDRYALPASAEFNAEFRTFCGT
jgi:uncharacterized protein YdiU (UPF0061 family)